MSTAPEGGAHRGPTDISRDDAGHDGSVRNTTIPQGTPHQSAPRNTHAAQDAPPDTGAPAPAPAAEPHRGEVLDRQKERFGGIKWGSAFFGWLTAIGTAVLLSALLAAIGGAIGLSAAGGPGQAAAIIAAIVAAVVLLIAYYCGGYVAGRMARFNGMKQGIAVWIWTIVITVLAAALAAVAGSQFNVLGSLGGLRLPADPAALGVGGIIAALVALAVSLVGAVLGGLAGMRFHRKVDRAGFDTDHGDAR